MGKFIISSVLSLSAAIILFVLPMAYEQHAVEGLVQEKVFMDRTTEIVSDIHATGNASMPIIPIASSTSTPEKYILFVNDIKLYANRETWLEAKKNTLVRITYNGLNQIQSLESLEQNF